VTPVFASLIVPEGTNFTEFKKLLETSSSPFPILTGKKVYEEL
jgi:hypothetical protein